jgi:hypothetical protein
MRELKIGKMKLQVKRLSAFPAGANNETAKQISGSGP